MQAEVKRGRSLHVGGYLLLCLRERDTLLCNPWSVIVILMSYPGHAVLLKIFLEKETGLCHLLQKPWQLVPCGVWFCILDDWPLRLRADNRFVQNNEIRLSCKS